MATEKTVESTSAPRGRIYDRNYNLLVDNEGVKTIYYKKQNGITNKEEIELAYTVADNINLDYSKVNENRLKTFYYKGHYKECKKKITDKCNSYNVTCSLEFTRDELSAAIGSKRSIIAVTDAGFAKKFKQLLSL